MLPFRTKSYKDQRFHINNNNNAVQVLLLALAQYEKVWLSMCVYLITVIYKFMNIVTLE